MSCSTLQSLRYGYTPKLPVMMRDGVGSISVIEGEETHSESDQERIKELFPNTYGMKEVYFRKGSSTATPSKHIVGVILSGGQARRPRPPGWKGDPIWNNK